MIDEPRFYFRFMFFFYLLYLPVGCAKYAPQYKGACTRSYMLVYLHDKHVFEAKFDRVMDDFGWHTYWPYCMTKVKPSLTFLSGASVSTYVLVRVTVHTCQYSTCDTLIHANMYERVQAP